MGWGGLGAVGLLGGWRVLGGLEASWTHLGPKAYPGWLYSMSLQSSELVFGLPMGVKSENV